LQPEGIPTYTTPNKKVPGTDATGDEVLYQTELHPLARMTGFEPATTPLAVEVTDHYTTAQQRAGNKRPEGVIVKMNL
jgi:hypothetical protein